MEELVIGNYSLMALAPRQRLYSLLVLCRQINTFVLFIVLLHAEYPACMLLVCSKAVNHTVSPMCVHYYSVCVCAARGRVIVLSVCLFVCLHQVRTLSETG